jgi:LacI family transcriptional regulator
MRVIQEYNYVPHASAQILAGKKNRTIGLFIIDAGHVSSDMLTNMLIVSVIENASSLGYYVLTNIIRTTMDKDSIRNVKEMFYQRRIDGGIFIGAANHEPFIEELIAEGFTVGIVDHELPGRNEPNRLIANFDNESGMMQVIDYLVSLNHSDIGIIIGDMKRYSGPSKYQAFLAAMRKYDLPVKENWVLPGTFSEIGGYQAVKNYMKTGRELPTAIVAANDSAAFGAIKALEEYSIKVPDDISVVGFDDHVLSARFQPALTTVKVDFNEMMGKLTSFLIRQIEQGQGEVRKFMVGYELIIRNSCKKI